MQSKAYLTKGYVGIPDTTTLSVENGTLRITAKDGSSLINVPLASVTDVGQGTGYITFNVAGQKYTVEFYSSWLKLISPFGLLIFGRKALTQAKAWRTFLESQGVVVKKQL